MTTKAAFDGESLRGTLGQPHVLGPLLGAAPEFTRTLTGATGGLGLMALTSLLRDRGHSFGAFFRGPIGGRSPAAAPPAPRPVAAPPRPAAPPPPPRPPAGAW